MPISESCSRFDLVEPLELDTLAAKGRICGTMYDGRMIINMEEGEVHNVWALANLE